ncbi:MAG TPA: hypothetical protein DCS93_28185 [Microscillaceae bacterium]|nr:hypothetical protein [Microscillaceae bacterium]
MRSISIIVLSILMNLPLFAQTETSQMKSMELNFEGKTFNLPMSTKMAQDKFNLNKYHRNGDINHRKFVSHVKGDETVVGITAYTRIYKENSESSVEVIDNPREQHIAKLQKKYKSTFKPLKMGNPFFIDPKFVYMELEDNTIVVVGTLFYNLMYNTYTTVSFFKGVTVQDLPKYLRALY